MIPPGVVTVVPASVTAPASVAPVAGVPATARRDPLAAARAWFTVVCDSVWTEPFAARYTATKAAMTAQAWAYADPARDVRGAQWWQGVVAARETRTCLEVSAARFKGPAPSGPNQVPVVLTATRQVTTDMAGVPARQESINELRMMVRGADGLWSVGPLVMAG